MLWPHFERYAMRSAQHLLLRIAPALVVLLTACATSVSEPGAQLPWQALHPAVATLEFAPVPDSRVHVMRVDLQARGVRVELSPMTERGQTLDAMASGRGALLSINASFFDARFAPRELTTSQGERWAPVMLAGVAPVFACTVALSCEITFEAPVQDLAAWAMAVGGTPWLLRTGTQRQASDDGSCHSLCAQTHPRTAIGLDRRGRFLYLVQAEGRRAPVLGLTLVQLSSVMHQVGAFNAMNLDGGGSSSLLVNGQSRMARPANEPQMRRLANALHVFVGSAS